MNAQKKVVIASGYFNPPHVGHLNLLREAKKLGDYLVVIINNDDQVKVKGSTPFMLQEERMALIADLKYVDEVFLSVDQDGSVAKSLAAVAEKFPGLKVRALGGDRNFDNIPESEKPVCKEYNITIVNQVGGDKVQSSSWLIKNATKNN